VELVLLPGRGLRRSWSAAAVAQNLVSVLALCVALARGVALVVTRRPRVVVSVGGYAAFGAAAGAVVARRPLVLVDLDAAPGLVHRLLRRFATAIASAFPGDPDPRVVITGAPIRDEVTAVTRTPEQREAARARLGLAEDGTVVAIVSGSLGAGSVNRAACELAARWRDRPAATLYHVAGRRDEPWVLARKQEAQVSDAAWRVVGFESHLPDVWASCDVAVSRAGATTVAELCATGVPSVIVPLPGAPGDHQSKNAAVLERAGAAVVIDDGSVSGTALDAVLVGLLDDPARLETMSKAARSLARPDAARRVAEVVLEHAR
jgi:UDP-N-acetylglucosamine--N-acetylmuramyl-(pentapeptide) pyrophosphoryl-undecaprenol N-acetylglucosamine transferase